MGLTTSIATSVTDGAIAILFSSDRCRLDRRVLHGLAREGQFMAAIHKAAIQVTEGWHRH
jgi:hypothetical protein